MPTRESASLSAPSLPFIDFRGIGSEGGGFGFGPFGHTSKEVVRSFRRVAAILGLGLTAVGVWYSASYAYRRYYISYAEKKLREHIGATTGSNFAGDSEPRFIEPTEENQSLSMESSQAIEENQNLIPIAQDQVVEVILHQCPRGFRSPCISPFPLKLETFLRVAGIPYKVDPSGSVTFPDGLEDGEKPCPWLTINGVDILDSHHCIPELRQIFGIDLESQAAPPRQTACNFLDSHLDYKVYWVIELWRWVFDAGKSIPLIQPIDNKSLEFIPKITEHIRQMSKHHGYGRHEPEQIIKLTKRLLIDVASLLGNHDYFLGASPGEVDCAAFSLLTQMVFNMPGSPFEKEIQKFPKLLNYVERMKTQYWEDWDSILQKEASAHSLETPSDTNVEAEKHESEASPEPIANDAQVDYSCDDEPQQHEETLPVPLETRVPSESTASYESHGLDYSRNVVNQDQHSEQWRADYERQERYFHEIIEIEAKMKRGERLTPYENDMYHNYLLQKQEEYRLRHQAQTAQVMGHQTAAAYLHTHNDYNQPGYAYDYGGSPVAVGYYRESYQMRPPIVQEADYQPSPQHARFQPPLRRTSHAHGHPTISLTDDRDRFRHTSRGQIQDPSSYRDTILPRPKSALSPAP